MKNDVLDLAGGFLYPRTMDVGFNVVAFGEHQEKLVIDFVAQLASRLNHIAPQFSPSHECISACIGQNAMSVTGITFGCQKGFFCPSEHHLPHGSEIISLSLGRL